MGLSQLLTTLKRLLDMLERFLAISKKSFQNQKFLKDEKWPFRRPCISSTQGAMIPFLHSLSRESSELLNETNRHEIGSNLAENEPRLKCDFWIVDP